jgi:hypothetical protein
LPTQPGVYAPYGNEDVVTVQEPQASQTVAAFLSGSPEPATTPPLDQYGDAETVTASPPTTATPTTGSTSTSSGGSSSSPAAPTTAVASFDPRPC